MATAKENLNTKRNSEKAAPSQKLAGVKPTRVVGGPDNTWTAKDYVTFNKSKWDVAKEIQPDKTLLPKASVKAEPMPKGQTLKGIKGLKEGAEPTQDELDAIAASGEDEIDATVDYDPDYQDDDEIVLEIDDLLDDSGENVVDLGADEGDVALDTEGDELPVEGDEPVECTCGAAEGCTCGACADVAPEETEGDDAEVSDEETDGDETEEADEDEDDDVVKEATGDSEVPALRTDHLRDIDLVDESDESKEDLKESRIPKVKISFRLNEALLAENESLSDADRKALSALFEMSVRSTAKKIGAQLKEAYRKQAKQIVESNEAKLSKRVDQYLTYVVESWAKANDKQLRGVVRHKLSENFIAGLQKLFVENYIDVPESKVDVVNVLTTNVSKLKQRLAESETKLVNQHAEGRKALMEANKRIRAERKARLISESANALVSADRGAFKLQARDLSYKGDDKAFVSALSSLKESFTERTVSAGSKTLTEDAQIMEEPKSGSESSNKVSGSARYVKMDRAAK